MFYVVSKILTGLLQPSSLAALLIGVGLALAATPARARFGKRLAATGLILLAILGIAPVGNVLVYPLEQRFAAVPQPVKADGYSGIIILGGFEDGWVSATRANLAVNEAAERLTEAVRLARLLPDAQIVFSGGAGGIVINGIDAAGPSYRRISVTA